MVSKERKVFILANVKILAEKQKVIDEIKERLNTHASIVLFNYQKLTDDESKQLRRELRKTGSDYKIYKNTLVHRAMNDLNIELTDVLNGPSALAYGDDPVAPIKVLTDFAKTHPAVVLKAGLVDGGIADAKKLAEYATIPSRDGLLTMLAGGMIGIARDLSICLDLYANQKQEN